MYLLRREIRTLKIAALVFLLLAWTALEASGAEGSSGISMQEIDASEIQAKIQKGQAVEYDHVIVRGDLDLSRKRLQKNITSPIRINDSIFSGQVSFRGTTLEMPVDLSDSNFAKDAIFSEAKFSKDAYFAGDEFGEGAYLGWATFSGIAEFSNSMFSKYVSFNEATFRDRVYFSESIFSGDAEFFYATFSRDVIFWNSTFSRKANFGEAIFSERADFAGAEFSGDADFAGAEFSGDAYFAGAEFGGDAYFAGAEFSGDAEFWDATFEKDATFSRTKFSWSDFTRAIFRWNAEFWGATFSKDVYFSRAKFSGIADFGGVIFLPQESIFFEEATSSVETRVAGATFGGNAYFDSANFGGYTRFDMAEFNGIAEFGDVIFKNETSFYRILFKRPAYFENCSIESLDLTKADFSRLHLRWENITRLHFDEAAYLALIKNYNNLGWYGDANRCYYDYRNAVRKNWRTASSTGFEARILKLFNLLIDYMEWLLYGYGVRPVIPISWSAIIILAFGLFFWHKKCLRKIIVEEKIEEAKDASDKVQIKTTARRAEIGALDPILFSLFTFTSGFTSFLHPTIEYKLERCVRWAIFERLLGPFFMALVITTISKTYLIR